MALVRNSPVKCSWQSFLALKQSVFTFIRSSWHSGWNTKCITCIHLQTVHGETIHRHLEIWMIWIEHICCSTRGASGTISSILKEDTIKALLYYSLVHTYIGRGLLWPFLPLPFFPPYLLLGKDVHRLAARCLLKVWNRQVTIWREAGEQHPLRQLLHLLLTSTHISLPQPGPPAEFYTPNESFFGAHLLRETQGYAG